EEGEAVAPAVAREPPRRRDVLDMEAVLDHAELVARQAPVDVALEQEVARADIQVGELQEGLDEDVALEELALGNVREAGAALGRRRAIAQRLALGFHHLAVVVADR